MVRFIILLLASTCRQTVDAFSTRTCSQTNRPRSSVLITNNRRRISATAAFSSNTTAGTEDVVLLKAGTINTNIKNRFNSTSPTNAEIDSACVIEIHGKYYDVQAFAKAHPGGSSVLKRYHDKDATKAFEVAGHSEKARQLLQRFEVPQQSREQSTTTKSSIDVTTTTNQPPLWRRKLFTNEDPIGYHKYLGIFCLLHYIWRHVQIFTGKSLTAGFGSIPNINPYILFWLLPHALLNASAFIFHTVPRERIVGSPMIWKEYRVHNFIFVLRSIVATMLCHLAIVKQHSVAWRRVAVIGSAVSILVANYAADLTTSKLQPAHNDSSVASLPFWPDCSLKTQRRIKNFYAYCQFMATIACLMVSNPAWPFIVMMPIQFSSILLTLVRKNLLGAKGWHVAYLISLLFPFGVASIHMLASKAIDVPLAVAATLIMFVLRCRGVSKYALWGTAGALRILYGDRILAYDIW